MTEIATEQGHWYGKDGAPQYTYIDYDGIERPTTLKQARNLLLRPGVTTITGEANSYNLTEWKIKQGILAALTLPRNENEPETDYLKRVLEDSKKEGKTRADEGSQLHTALEKSIQGLAFDPRWYDHVQNVWTTLSGKDIELGDGESERSFCHPLGYGGKGDWHSKTQNIVLDFKSKDKIEKGKKYAFDDQLMQLVACAHGFGLAKYDEEMQDSYPRLINVFIGIKDAKVLVHEWDKEEAPRAWEMFKSLLSYWMNRTRCWPK